MTIGNIVSVALQISGVLIWPIVEDDKELWLIPFSLLMISCHWWENYLSPNMRISEIILELLVNICNFFLILNFPQNWSGI